MNFLVGTTQERSGRNEIGVRNVSSQAVEPYVNWEKVGKKNKD